MPDEPVCPAVAALHIETAAEDAAGNPGTILPVTILSWNKKERPPVPRGTGGSESCPEMAENVRVCHIVPRGEMWYSIMG